MKKRNLLPLLLLAGLSIAQAQPKASYAEARAIYDELGAPVAKTPIWFKKPIAERHKAVQDADALIRRAEKVWGTAAAGPNSACRAAAIAMKFYIIGLNDLALLVEGKPVTTPATLFAPSFNAVNFGESKARCQEQVDSLERRS